MILAAVLVLAVSFCAGCLLGQWATLRSVESLGRRGWRSWYLGRIYPYPPAADEVRVAARAERAVREGKVPPAKGPMLS